MVIIFIINVTNVINININIVVVVVVVVVFVVVRNWGERREGGRWGLGKRWRTIITTTTTKNNNNN